MPRPKNTIQTVHTLISLPQHLWVKLRLHLHSEVEQRIPQGAQMRFFSERVREFFDHKILDLSPWLGTAAGTMLVAGEPEVIEALQKKLSEGKQR